MGLVKYNTDTGFRKFNIASTIKDHWGIDYTIKECLVGVELQDRKKKKHTVEISDVFWNLGILCVSFREGGWLALDHAIEQFKVRKHGN